MIFSLLYFLSLGFIITFSFSSFLRNVFSAKAIDVNGLETYPVIGCVISFHRNRHRLLDWFTHLLSESLTQTIVLRKLGPARIIVTANPENVEYILKTNFHNFPKGKPFTDLLGDFLGHGIFNVDGKLWSAQRKLASHEFSTRSLREFVVNVLEEEVRDRLLPLLERAAGNDAILDMQEVLRRFAFDTISKITLGYDPSCLDLNKPVPEFMSAFDNASAASAVRGVAPAYAVWKTKRFFSIGSEGKLKAAVRVVHEAVENIIAQKREKMEAGNSGDRDSDLLSRFITAGFGDEMVRDMVVSFLMAGRDTTSAAMTWMLWLLTSHRSIEREVVEEVTSINGGERVLNFEDLKQMDFLKACLCESMRLYPPVVWDSKHAGNDDVLPDGTPVYKGNRVTYFPYGMGRMESIWGKDCLEFRPDRWFDEPGVLKMESPYKFPVFQAGPRVCLGKEMAFIQMKYVVTSILRQFELVPVGSDRPAYVPFLTAHMAGGFKVRVRRRSG